MKTFLFVLFAFVSVNATGQYYMFETKLSCSTDKPDLIRDGHGKIITILNGMVKEGKLLNFRASQKNEKNKLDLVYTVTAQNDAAFKQITDEWKKRSLAIDSKLFESFWLSCPNRKDTLVNKTQLMYPYIKGDINAPVAVVEGIDEKPDPTLTYNMVFDFTAYPELEGKKFKMDSSEANWGLSDIGRIYNLHVAAGIPRDKINFVVAIHSGNATRSFFNNETYRNKYKIDNPNLPIIEELSNAGVKFLVCGQSLTWFGFNKNMLSSRAKVTLTAQTTLSSYQLKGYALKNMSND